MYDRFKTVRDAFAQNFARGSEIGASVNIAFEGVTVVDLRGSYVDENLSRLGEVVTLLQASKPRPVQDRVHQTVRSSIAWIAIMGVNASYVSSRARDGRPF